MQTMQDVVHSKMLKAGGKTYFFDVKKAKNGNHYLTISETYKKQDGEQVRNRVMIFKEAVSDFSSALHEAQGYL